MKTAYVQEPPNAVQIELTEGCNLRCDFCGLQGIREAGADKNFKFTKLQTMSRIASEMARCGWNSRVEFAMHGEPTMHPNFVAAVQVFRKHLPHASIMMTTNGGGLLRHPGPVANVNALFAAGLNIVAFDDYKYVKIGEKIRFAFKHTPPVFPVFEYPAQLHASPHTRTKPTEHRFVFIQDISLAAAGTHATLNNHAGAGAPTNTKGAGKRCTKPFRELSFRWDGNVAVCCNDWRGEYKVANINTLPLDELWLHPRFEAARRYLYAGDRAGLAPCAGCDATSTRVGLLPDRMGLRTLPAPTAADAKVVRQATAGKPFTPPVLREWEAK